MAEKLTKKQKGFVKDYLETGNATEAASLNYEVSNRDTARAIGTENLAKPAIQAAVQEAFPDGELYSLHREGLYDEDLLVRHKYLDTAYKLKGSYAAEKHLNINLDGTTTSRTKELGNRLLGLFGRGDKPSV